MEEPREGVEEADPQGVFDLAPSPPPLASTPLPSPPLCTLDPIFSLLRNMWTTLRRVRVTRAETAKTRALIGFAFLFGGVWRLLGMRWADS